MSRFKVTCPDKTERELANPYTSNGGFSSTIGEIREEILNLDQLFFDGKGVLDPDKAQFNRDYSSCYYESDEPSLEILLHWTPQDNCTEIPDAKKNIRYVLT